MKKFEQRIASAAQMSREELFSEVSRRLRAGTIVLPESGPERTKALALAVLEILNERYSSTAERLESLT